MLLDSVLTKCSTTMALCQTKSSLVSDYLIYSVLLFNMPNLTTCKTLITNKGNLLSLRKNLQINFLQYSYNKKRKNTPYTRVRVNHI